MQWLRERRRDALAAVLAALCALPGCRTEPAAARGQSGARDAALKRWLLPHRLDEISGLVLTPDGRLFAHEDEQGRIFEIDYRHGSIVKEFAIGPAPVFADFEAIALVRDTLVLLSSDGRLFMFREGANGSRVDYRVYDTGLGTQCEFEGLAFDPAINSLLLACKNTRAPHLRRSLVIFRWKWDAPDGSRTSRLEMPGRELHPSDITLDPYSGNYVLIAAREKEIVEVTPRGDLVVARPLPGEHPQPEGLAITHDSILIVSDERSRGASVNHPYRSQPDAFAILTLYRWPLP